MTKYLPFATILIVSPAEQRQLAALLPLVAAMRPVESGAAAYVCRNFSCRPAVTTVEELTRELSS